MRGDEHNNPRRPGTAPDLLSAATDIDELINAYFDRELDDRQTAVLERLLARDPRRKADFDTMRADLDSLRDLPPAPDFRDRVIEDVSNRIEADAPLSFHDRGFRPAPRRWNVGAIAACVALAGGAIGLGAVLFAPSILGNHANTDVASTNPADDTTPPSPALMTSTTVAPAVASDSGTDAEHSEQGSRNRPRRSGDVATRPTGLAMEHRDDNADSRRWDTALEPLTGAGGSLASTITETDATGVTAGDTDPASRVGQIVSVRLGPTWSLWWIPGDSPNARESAQVPWSVLKDLAHRRERAAPPSTPAPSDR